MEITSVDRWTGFVKVWAVCGDVEVYMTFTDAGHVHDSSFVEGSVPHAALENAAREQIGF